MKSKIEIIEETATFYNSNNRSIIKDASGEDRCLYNGTEGKQCAFARVCINPTQLIENENASDMLNRFGQSILKEEYRGHSGNFWDDIQQLHDMSTHWDENGLTEIGLCYKQTLIEQYEKAEEDIDDYDVLQDFI